MALADVYELAKDYTPRAGELVVLLKNGLDGLLQYQDRESQMFLQVVDHAGPVSYTHLMKASTSGEVGSPDMLMKIASRHRASIT